MYRDIFYRWELKRREPVSLMRDSLTAEAPNDSGKQVIRSVKVDSVSGSLSEQVRRWLGPVLTLIRSVAWGMIRIA